MEQVHKQRVAIYCRSCHEKTKELVEAQTAGAIDMVKCHPEWNPLKVYADFGADGHLKGTRPGLHQLIEDCKSGIVDIVIFPSISRLSRYMLETIGYIREFRKMGVRVFFEKEGVDTEDEFIEKILDAMTAFAEEVERDK